MIYETIFILIAFFLCLYVIQKSYEYDLKEMWFTVFQIIFVVVICLFFLKVENIVLFILFVLVSFVLKSFFKNLFFSKRRIKITKK